MRFRTASRWAVACLSLAIAMGLLGCGTPAQPEATAPAVTDTAAPAATEPSPPADTPTPEDTAIAAATVVEPTLEASAATPEATGEALTFEFPTLGNPDAPVTIIEFSDYL